MRSLETTESVKCTVLAYSIVLYLHTNQNINIIYVILLLFKFFFNSISYFSKLLFSYGHVSKFVVLISIA